VEVTVQEKLSALQALMFVAALFLILAGMMIALVARSHVNRDTTSWTPLGDYSPPPFKWPWLLSYAFLTLGLLALGALLFALA